MLQFVLKRSWQSGMATPSSRLSTTLKSKKCTTGWRQDEILIIHHRPDTTARMFHYSRYGHVYAYSTNLRYERCVDRMLAISNPRFASMYSVKVFDASTMEKLCEIERANVIDFWLSPQGSYLATWERPSKSFSPHHHVNRLSHSTFPISQTWERCWQQQSCYLGHKDWPGNCRLFPKSAKQLVNGIMHSWLVSPFLTFCFSGTFNGLTTKSTVLVWSLAKSSSGKARISANVSSGSCVKGSIGALDYS